jgi:hypothetical protein
MSPRNSDSNRDICCSGAVSEIAGAEGDGAARGAVSRRVKKTNGLEAVGGLTAFGAQVRGRHPVELVDREGQRTVNVRPIAGRGITCGWKVRRGIPM